jgi:hypothetical protein
MEKSGDCEIAIYKKKVIIEDYFSHQNNWFFYQMDPYNNKSSDWVFFFNIEST